MTTMSWFWILPPALALIYSWTAELFLFLWWESTFLRKGAITQRLVVTIACVATILAPQHDHQALLVVKISILLISLYFLYDTRTQVVQGGPPPPFHTPSSSSSRVIVITGANTGIGKETARLLASEHTTIIIACRSVVKAQQAVDDIRQQILKARIECVEMDLSSLTSVRNAARQLQQKYPVIDVLINNAGLMHAQYELTQDGYEQVFQVNHLGHYLWTRLLLPSVLRSPNPKIINVTSSTYILGTREKSQNNTTVFPFHDLQCNQGRAYTLFGQYGVSKLANIYFTMSLAQKYTNIQCCAVHPGLVRTDVVRNMPWYLRYPNQIFGWLIQALQKTPTQGAWGTVHATNMNVQSGLYWVNRKPQPLRGVTPIQVSEEAEQLWMESAKLVQLPPQDNVGLASKQ
ncbi:hypothetical protein FisN_7Lh088 [Fistulifera solaris]|uniref:Retinol dehydrogenase 12 n=1 Tax=Fistulifera solaris TaxID=1519565 RepID=A0A1Z5JD67_FISSO|nr:hypothetical protein FisN_7Lh088 [Fistulifera solaris]|eukprot:GAX11718.1 hypothetical protein FisN_7Lh088 [Fistulifera solaris]